MANESVIRNKMLSYMLFIVNRLYIILYKFKKGSTLFKNAYARLLIYIGDMCGNFSL